MNKERWMREWMTHPKSGISPSPLRLGRFREPIYFLLNSITWKPNSEQASQFEPVEVPVGFVTDLASIPQIFFRFAAAGWRLRLCFDCSRLPLLGPDADQGDL